MKATIAIIGAKATRKASRMLGKGGGDMPGRIARKIDQNILGHLAEQVETIIVITGTNGKTTTSNLLANILKEAGEEIIHNAEGNNLITGITTSFITKAKPNGVLHKPYRYAVLEVDEANIPLVMKETRPNYLIVNNFFRDQLNRYGEIDTIVEKVKDGAKRSNATLVLNGDDPFVMRIGLLSNPTVFFGLSKEAYAFDQYSMNESKFCPTCGSELTYEHVHYGQLGFYQCGCGFKRPNPTYEVSHIQDDLQFVLNDERFQLGIAGTYNVYNAAGAIACAKEMGIASVHIEKALKNYQATNGRMQEIVIGETVCSLNLAKNQVGADISISEMTKDPNEKQIFFVLNDLAHDSADISWIWDADFERLAHTPISHIICSGTRAEDMALRLKYAGVDTNKVQVIKDIEPAIDQLIQTPGKTYCLPTYTALDPVRKALEKRKH